MTLPKIVIVCQARMGSSRLPGKVLLPLAGATLLERFIERVQRSKLADAVVVATTMRTEDGAIISLCEQHGWLWYRGHSTDLLDRTYHAGLSNQADVIVKVPSDCPLIDPDIIDLVIERFLERYPNIDFTSNLHPATWPDGNDVEVMQMSALKRAYSVAKAPHEREHTTPWLWERNAGIRCSNVLNPCGTDYSASHRWTIDYREDYELIRSVYDALYDRNPAFTTDDVLAYLKRQPDVASINAHLRGITWQSIYNNNIRRQHETGRRFIA